MGARVWGVGARLVTLVLLTLALLPSATAVAGDSSASTDWVGDTGQAGNPLVFGIASHAWWLDPETFGDQLLPALDDLKVTTVRLSIDWRRFEPTEGTYDWGMYDRVFGELAKRNIVIVADFNTIPPWASTNQAGCADPKLEIYTCQLREDRYPAFEAAARAAVTRYAWIDNWEFWNEPEQWRYLGQDGTVYLRHLRTFYDIAHQVNPQITVAAQTLVGTEYMGYIWNVSDAWYGVGHYPWDAISIHPYNWNYVAAAGEPHLEINYDRISALHDLMLQRGTPGMNVWVTEFGWNNGADNQAANITQALNWLKRQPYIKFAHLHMLHDWNEEQLDSFGLLKILPDQYGVPRLTPDSLFAPKEPFYDAFKNAPRDDLGNAPSDPASMAFRETGHSVDGRFLTAWLARGGARILGYPLTRPYPRQQTDGNWLLVQDFERARLEFHPQYLSSWGEVEGELIGNEIAAQRRAEPPFQPLGDCPVTPDHDCFAATGHSLAGGFRAFWQQHGGLATFGYPISEEFRERNPDTGLVYTVQYFERARMEYHPEFAGTEYAVLLGRLIGNQLDAAGWTTSDDLRLPTRREFQ